MKKDKIIFWISTTVLALMMLFSAYNYLANDQIKGAFVHLGFPSYFRIELAVAKILGAIVLLVPFASQTVKSIAYIGFGITFISAFIAHLSSGDRFSYAAMPLIFLAVLIVSYLHQTKKTAAIPA
ncbi:MAG: DoxX family protein [Bacteroidetes bacterium]|nr:DoxX family protein [Bacteroidota bacterium]